MRQAMLLALMACLAAGPLRAYSASDAQVTPDPGFTVAGWADKWPHISVAELQRLRLKPGVLLLDGRPYSEWAQSHLPGAVSLPAGEFDKRYAMQKAKLLKAKLLVIYCHGATCRLSDHVADLLAAKGLRHLAVFWGGFPEWKSAGLPLEDLHGRPVKP